MGAVKDAGRAGFLTQPKEGRLPPAIVSDYDRTLTDATLVVYEPAMDALKKIQEQGGTKVLLATGRGMPFVNQVQKELSFADAVVAENGAVIWLPGRDRLESLGDGTRAKAALRASGIPYEEGDVVVSVKKEYEPRVRELVLRDLPNVQIHFNQDSVMLLPKGVDKVVGVRRALELLGVPAEGLVCIGDGENDIALFDIGDVKVATGEAVQALKDRADIICDGPYAIGVARFLGSLLSAGGHGRRDQTR